MGHRSATVVVYFVGTHLTWGMRVLGQWTWAVGSWACYLWSLVLGFGLVYLRRRFYVRRSGWHRAVHECHRIVLWVSLIWPIDVIALSHGCVQTDQRMYSIRSMDVIELSHGGFRCGQ